MTKTLGYLASFTKSSRLENASAPRTSRRQPICGIRILRSLCRSAISKSLRAIRGTKATTGIPSRSHVSQNQSSEPSSSHLCKASCGMCPGFRACPAASTIRLIARVPPVPWDQNCRRRQSASGLPLGARFHYYPQASGEARRRPARLTPRPSPLTSPRR
jgi:hypothetical protein